MQIVTNTSYDQDVDAAYITVGGTSGERISTQQRLVTPNIILDFDAQGYLLGVEILNASTSIHHDDDD